MATYIKGVDVSRWQQPHINWQQVYTEGYQFAFIKCTDGSSYKKQFIDIGRAHAKAAAAAGLKIGYYHFAHPTNFDNLEKDARSEANYLLATLKKDFLQPDFPLVLDFEDSNMHLLPEEAKKWIAVFYAVVQKAGYEMIFYSYAPYINTHLPKTHELGDMPLWLASYPTLFDINKKPKAPVGWTEWKIWQYTNKGSVKGINGAVDLNVMDQEFFNKY